VLLPRRLSRLFTLCYSSNPKWNFNLDAIMKEKPGGSTIAADSRSDSNVEKVEVRISKKRQALYAVLVFVVFLFLLEGVLRLFGIPADERSLRNDPGMVIRSQDATGTEYTRGWRGYHAGVMVRINSAGWRGKEFSPQKTEGTIRILGIGDSFTFGKAVEEDDVYLVKIEQMLNGDTGPRYEAINAGRDNMSTARELKYLKQREMLKLKPDAVVLGFTVHNDAQVKNNKNAKLLRRYERTASLPLRVSESDWFKDLAGTSRIAAVLRTGIRWAHNSQLTDFYYRTIVSNYDDGSKTWDECREALGGIYGACHENQTPLVVVLFPVYTKRLDETYNQYPEDFKRIHDKVTKVFSGKDGVVVVDMLEDLALTGLTIRQLTVPVDGHPNRVWHDIVAVRLYQTIRDLGLESNHLKWDSLDTVLRQGL